MRRFALYRDRDVSGVSGTGFVAVGVVWPSGKVILEWQTHTPSLGVYESLAAMKRIHGHGGATRVVFVDPRDPWT